MRTIHCAHRKVLAFTRTRTRTHHHCSCVCVQPGKDRATVLDKTRQPHAMKSSPSSPLGVLGMLCVCVYLCSTHGQIAGDPAPGRSPGPPADGGGVSGSSIVASSTHSSSDAAAAAVVAVAADNETIERNSNNSNSGSNTMPEGDLSGSESDNTATRGSSDGCANRAAREYRKRMLVAKTVAAGDAASVRLALTHDVFDAEQGLVGQIVYTGTAARR